MRIQFFFLQKNISIAHRATLKKFISDIFKRERKKLESLSYVFCSDDYLLEINKSHLKHNYYTDIITFDLSETPERITGEIYISIDRVRDNAANLDVTINEELHRVIFHGVLHLCGYNDKKTADKKKMRTAENECLGAYFK